MKPQDRPPLWFALVVIATLLPLLAWPWIMISTMTGAPSAHDMRFILIMAFPIYAIASAWLAYRSFRRRSDLAWVLIAMLILSYAALAWLIFMVPQYVINTL